MRVVTACYAMLLSVEITNTQIHVLIFRSGTDSEEKLSDSTLFAVVVDAQRHHHEGLLAITRLPPTSSFWDDTWLEIFQRPHRLYLFLGDLLQGVSHVQQIGLVSSYHS